MFSKLHSWPVDIVGCDRFWRHVFLKAPLQNSCVDFSFLNEGINFFKKSNFSEVDKTLHKVSESFDGTVLFGLYWCFTPRLTPFTQSSYDFKESVFDQGIAVTRLHWFQTRWFKPVSSKNILDLVLPVTKSFAHAPGLGPEHNPL